MVKHMTTGAQVFCLVTPVALVALVLFFFLRSTSRVQYPDLTGLQKALHFLLGLMVGIGAAGLLFLVPDNDLFVHISLFGLFCLIDLLALIGGAICLRRRWRFVGFGRLAVAVSIPVLLLFLPPYIPPPFH